MTLSQGDRFDGRYNVLRLVERGGIALVYEVAVVEHIGRRLLLKVPRPVFASDPRALDLFTRERLAFANLTSEHVVRVVEHGLGPDGPWMLTERCEGEPLSRRVARRGPLSWSDARRVLGEAGDALSAAHAQGVLHLDLRPENVLLVRDGETARERVMVVDFGLSSAAMELASELTSTPPRTRPAWMAPEQHDRSAYPDARADVWTYGLLAFWSLTGRAYWSTVDADGHASDVSELLREVRGERHPASFRAIALEVADRLPAGFDAWFARCVANDPNARFDDLASASAALDEVFATASGPERPSVARTPAVAFDPLVSGPAYRAPTFTVTLPVTAPAATPSLLVRALRWIRGASTLRRE
ncbi:MAG: serine/threonine-protein kinase [Polyangiales bacterium]